jgi:hypothetical protein
MPVERRGQVADVGSEPTGNRRSSNSQRKAAASRGSPPRNSWTTYRLNSIECVRCLAMGFLLESPVQLADSQVPTCPPQGVHSKPR